MADLNPTLKRQREAFWWMDIKYTFIINQIPKTFLGGIVTLISFVILLVNFWTKKRLILI